MSEKPVSRHVVPHKDGWAVEKQGASRPSAVLPRQKDAIGRAKEIVGNAGGGEVRIHGKNGRIRNSDTVKPGTIRSRLGTASTDRR